MPVANFPDSNDDRNSYPIPNAGFFLSRPGACIYLVGIKGTGMTALAEILYSRKINVNGSDVEEEFYTDAILKSLGIPFYSGFSEENLTGRLEDPGIDLVVYSSAYNPVRHPELAAAGRAGIPMMEYTRALGELSRNVVSGAVSGVHGKTTTTALAGSLVKALSLPGTVLAGSGVAGFGNRSTLIQGGDFLIAETCEYRRHFLRFNPDHIILTSIEPDHLDYFRDYDDIFSAFLEFIGKLPQGGTLIFCADDEGAARAALAAGKKRPDIIMIPYGISAEGIFRITGIRQKPGENIFRLEGWEGEFSLRVPGEHTVLDTAAALALVSRLAEFKEGIPSAGQMALMVEGLAGFSGSRRRSEILGEARGILFMDDYGHHPSAVMTTLRGLREFYPDRRLIVDFMSHTYSRTAGLFDEFCSSFSQADLLLVHKIYGSAREQSPGSAGAAMESDSGYPSGLQIDGKSLFEGIKASREKSGKREATFYFHEIYQAMDFLKEILKPGDLFLTMGAGNNWTLGRDLYDEMKNGVQL